MVNSSLLCYGFMHYVGLFVAVSVQESTNSVVVGVILSNIGASTAVDLRALLSLLFLWICVSFPLVYMGGFAGSLASTVEATTKNNKIPILVFKVKWKLHPIGALVIGGIVPFTAVYDTMTLAMEVLWLRKSFYSTASFFVGILCVASSCVLVSAFLSYYQMCSHGYCTWWKSFQQCGMAGFFCIYTAFAL